MDLIKLFGEELAKTVEEKLGNEYFIGMEKNYVNKDRFNEELEKVKNYKEMLDSRDVQLEELKKIVVDNDALYNELDQLKETNEKTVQEYEDKLQQTIFNQKLETALKDAGAKNSKAVQALLDKDSFKLNDSGELEGIIEAISKIKESDSYLFGQDILTGIKPNHDVTTVKTESITKELIDAKDKEGDTKWFIENDDEINKVLKGEI